MSRIDKYLYAVRLYKTRTLASDACRLERVLIDGQSVKASREIVEGQILTVRKPPITYTYRVVATLENRTSAKLVANYIEDITPEEEKNKIYDIKEGGFIVAQRQKGSGRPTKKERRDIDKYNDKLFE